MGLNAAQGQIVCPAAPGLQTITVGFQPTVVIFTADFQTASGFDVPWSHMLGAMDSVGAVGCHATYGQASPVTTEVTTRDDSCIYVFDTAGNLTCDALFDNYGATDFTINWNSVSTGVLINYLALGDDGTDTIKAEVGSFLGGITTGVQTVTLVDSSLTPQTIIAATNGATTTLNTVGTKGDKQGLGLCDALAITQGFHGYINKNKTSTNGVWHRSDVFLATTKKYNQVEIAGAIVGYATGSFDVDWLTAKKDARHLYIVFEVTGTAFTELVSFDTITSGTTQNVAVGGGDPTAIFAMCCGAPVDTQEAAESRIGIGLAAKNGAAADQGANSTSFYYEGSFVDNTELSTSDLVQVIDAANSSLNHELLNVSSMGTTSFDLSYTTVDAANARRVDTIVFGPPVTGAGAQNITDVSVGSTATVGAETITPQPVTVTDLAIGSSATVGVETISFPAQAVSDTTIPGSSTVGVESIGVGPVTVTDVTIGSGSTTGNETVTPQPVTVTDLAIGSSSSVGVETIVPQPVTITDTTIGSGSSTGVESIGVGPVTVNDAPIAGGSSTGTETLDPIYDLTDVSVTSPGSVGVEVVAVGAVTVTDVAIGSTVTIGLETVSTGSSAQTITDVSVGSTATVGAESVGVGPVTVTDTPIGSGASTGAESVSTGPVTVIDAPIGSGASVGVESVSVGPVTVLDAPIGSGASTGSESIALTVLDAPIGSTTTVGVESIGVGPVTVNDAPIGSSSSTGSESVGLTVLDVPIGSTASLGLETVSLGTLTIQDVVIVGSATLGLETISGGAATLTDLEVGVQADGGQFSRRTTGAHTTTWAGNVLPITLGSADPVGAPPSGTGVHFVIAGTTPSVHIWDSGAAVWRKIL